MKNIIFSFLLLIIICLILSSCEDPVKARTGDSSSEPDTLWTKTFGGSENDYGLSIHEAPDKGYVLLGYTYSYGVSNSDILLIKTDSQGKMLWKKTFGGASFEQGRSVEVTSNGAILSLGSTNSFGAGGYDFYLIKTDLDGNLLWQKTYGFSGYEAGSCVKETSNGDLVLLGTSASIGAGGDDFYLIKTDSNGEVIWSETYGESSEEQGNYLLGTKDGGFVLIGAKKRLGYGGGDYDIYMIKTNDHGTLEWSGTYGYSGEDVGYCVQETSEGGYIILGSTTSLGYGGTDFWLIKTNAQGEEIWNKPFGGSNNDEGRSVIELHDRGFLLLGTTASQGAGENDFLLIKTDFSGKAIWSKTIGGKKDDMGQCFIRNEDSEYVLLGSTESFGAGLFDFWMVKLEGQHPPQSFSLLYPFDRDTLFSEYAFFDWENAIDPDSDIVTYDLYFDSDSTFSSPMIIPDIAQSELTMTLEIENFSDYLWKVLAKDGKGEITWSREIFKFFTYYPEAVINVDPEYFNKTLFRNENADDCLFILNSGNINLDYVISWNTSWLNVIPFSGSLAPQRTDTLNVLFNSAKLYSGSYKDTIRVYSNAKQDSLKNILVSLSVKAQVSAIIRCDNPMAHQGENLEFQTGLRNNTSVRQVVDVWLDLYLFNGKPYTKNPVQGPQTLMLPPQYQKIINNKIFVPGNTPPGIHYKLYLRCGNYPEVMDESFFEFRVMP